MENLNLSIRDFNVSDDVVRIFESKIERDSSELIYDLEIYKFLNREEIIRVLQGLLPSEKIESIDEVNQMEVYRIIESVYGIIIDVIDSKNVRIIKSVFQQINLTALELQLKEFPNIEVISVTELNFRQLTEYNFSPVYDPMILFKRILIEVIKLGGTDLHFGVSHEDMKPVYTVQYRRDGDLFDLNLFEMTKELNQSIISRLVETKTSANSLDLSLADGVTANSSDILGNGNVELRIAANTVKDGLQAVIRIQERKTFSFDIGSLGFSKSTQDFLMWLSKKRSGITLITGAIRTGKNTTAFALAREMCKYPIKIVDYSSPIEVLMPFNQVDYLADEERLLACVRLAKKQDVNVAFLNEIPSKDVAFAVKDLVNSSIAVITTMHMDRIWHLPYKLNEYYGEGYKDVISQINGVINQKMFDIACPFCRKKYSVSSIKDKEKRDFLENRGLHFIDISIGCEKCSPVKGDLNVDGLAEGRNFSQDNSFKVGSVIGGNQPYVEFLKFDDELKSALLSCEYAWQMENIIKKRVKDNHDALEDTMFDGIKRGVLNYNALDYIL